MNNSLIPINIEAIKHFEEIDNIDTKKEIALGVLNNLIGYISVEGTKEASLKAICSFLDNQTKFAETGDTKYLFQ